LWGLIPIAILSWIAVRVEADRIEHDLEQRAGHALRAAGHDWAAVVFSGRDGVLVGTAPSEAAAPEALALVRGVWGVRTVAGRFRLETEAGGKFKPALPPIASTIVPLEPADAGLSDADAVVLAASATTVELAEASPDAVHAWEQEAVPETAAAADAEKTQEASDPTRVETAALAGEPEEPAEACAAAARALNEAEPVRFARGEAKLDGPSRGVLERFAMLAGRCPGVGLRVIGHTDARGKARRNLLLSQRRARAVVGYLVDKGIDARRLEAVGYGEARPVVPNDTARNRARNRRIELEVTGGDIPVPTTRQGAGNGLPDR
jgi:outer membrane protein OmpA-like peptidoglycan-associated protein